MSIWCSWDHIGTDTGPWYTAEGDPIPVKPERGQVLTYADGFSNHYPDITGSHERPALVGIAHIAPWCVPGHEADAEDLDDETQAPVGPWLRLGVYAPEALSFWSKTDGSPTVQRLAADVVMDADAVRALRDDLTAWLDRPRLEVTA